MIHPDSGFVCESCGHRFDADRNPETCPSCFDRECVRRNRRSGGRLRLGSMNRRESDHVQREDTA